MDFQRFSQNLMNYGQIATSEILDITTKNTGYCLTQTAGYSPVLTGKNKNSIKATVISNNEVAVGEVASGTTYAVGLELGTIRRAATPYFLPGLEDTKIKQKKDTDKLFKSLKGVIKT